MLLALCHSEGQGWTQVADPSTVSELRAADGARVLWGELDIADIDPASVETAVAEFSLDPLALEDATRPRQRPKLESYEHHHFAVLHQLYERGGQLEKKQVSCFIGDDYVLVLHESAIEVVTEARRRLTASSERPTTPLYLLYTLVDTIVDDYEEHADRLEDTVESIEERVTSDATLTGSTVASPSRRRAMQGVQLELYAIKQQVSRLRRYAVPVERVLHALLETEGARLGMSREDRRYFRDAYDHTLRIVDQVHQVDALAQGILEVIRSEQAEDLNQIQKRLTGWAAIFAVPTVIAGIYGMNYRLFPPAEESGWGFWFALGLMALAAVLLYLYFKNKEWI